jgi:hypothetical protein
MIASTTMNAVCDLTNAALISSWLQPFLQSDEMIHCVSETFVKNICDGTLDVGLLQRMLFVFPGSQHHSPSVCLGSVEIQ